MDQRNTNSLRRELMGRSWAYNHQIGLMGIVKAYECGCRSIYEIASYLEVTEDFLVEALKHYSEKYGVFATVDNYVIYFQPNAGVMKVMG